MFRVKAEYYTDERQCCDFNSLNRKTDFNYPVTSERPAAVVTYLDTHRTPGRTALQLVQGAAHPGENDAFLSVTALPGRL